MFVLEINNSPFPAPAEYALGMEPVGKFERNANGALVGDLTAMKTRLSCAWGMLPGAEYARLYNAARNYFARVRFTGQDGAETELDMTVQLREGALKLHREGDELWWGGVACEFVER